MPLVCQIILRWKTFLLVDNEDYRAELLDLVFPINSTNGTIACAQVPLINDQRFEKNERFLLIFNTSTLLPFINTPQSSALVNILDDDGMGYMQCRCWK